MDLSIIIVNYNTQQFLQDCLTTLIEHTHGVHYEIIVVDNASKDTSVDMLKREFPKVKIIASKENLGFAKANNKGAEVSTGEYLLFLNPDTIIIDNSINILFDFARMRKDCGAVGPTLYYNKEFEWQPSICKFDGLFRAFFKLMPIMGRLIKFFNSLYCWRKRVSGEAVSVDWMWGAAILLHRGIFNKIGRWDETFFMYHEDLDLCLRVRKSGKKVFYLQRARIIHLYSKSISNNLSKIKMQCESYVHLINKHSPRVALCIFFWFLHKLIVLKRILKLDAPDDFDKNLMVAWQRTRQTI